MNILLVILDSVRSMNCSVYGHENNTTPYLSKISSSATIFEQARSPSIRSSSSHASIFSGYHTEEHNVTEADSFLDPKANIWYQLGKHYGYDTGIFSPNVIITETMNLAEPFEKVVGPKREIGNKNKKFDGLTPSDIDGEITYKKYLSEALSSSNPLGSILNGLSVKFGSDNWGSQDPVGENGFIYVDEFLKWIDSVNNEWAACLNLMDAHSPYVPDSKYDLWAGEPIRELRKKSGGTGGWMSRKPPRPWGQLRALEALYDGCIRQLDSTIEYLVQNLKQRGEFEDTLLIITSDHGEGFGEQSKITPSVRLVNHNWGISEYLTHVPLIVKEPAQTQEKKISKVASLTNFPDVVEAAVSEDDIATESIAEHFVPDDRKVVSSTVKVVPPGDDLPIESERLKSYFGPWRAVYENEQDGVVKYAKRREDTATIHINSAQNSYTIPGEENKSEDIVAEIFDDMTDSNVVIDNSAEQNISKNTSDQLRKLGYLK